MATPEPVATAASSAPAVPAASMVVDSTNAAMRMATPPERSGTIAVGRYYPFWESRPTALGGPPTGGPEEQTPTASLWKWRRSFDIYCSNDPAGQIRAKRAALAAQRVR